ncbi:MAG: glycine cleavage system protein GcvH [Eubacteriales bacterium]|nr:glycine cleavage system protein GcvH [Eubacteriales bacterium]
MEVKKNLRYTKDHEWARPEGDRIFTGITDYAQHALGDIVFVELPEKGSALSKGDVLGTVESSKAASDIFSPLCGKVAEVNTELEDKPELVNEAPYDAWIAAMIPDDPAEAVTGLMDADEYEKYIKTLEHD